MSDEDILEWRELPKDFYVPGDRSDWCISPECILNIRTKNPWSHAIRVTPFFMDLRARDQTHTDSVVINHKM